MKNKHKIFIGITVTVVAITTCILLFCTPPIEGYYHTTGLDTSFSFGYWHFKDDKAYYIKEEKNKDYEGARRICIGRYSISQERNITISLDDGQIFTAKLGWLGFKYNEKVGFGFERDQICNRTLNPFKTKKFDEIREEKQ